jgi:hypothetical protein
MSRWRPKSAGRDLDDATRHAPQPGRRCAEATPLSAIALPNYAGESISFRSGSGCRFSWPRGDQPATHVVLGQEASSLRRRARATYDPTPPVVAVSFQDSIDADLDHMQVRRPFLAFAAKDRLAGPVAAIFVDQSSPLDLSRLNFARRVRAFGRWGLLDTTGYLFEMRTLVENEGRNEEAASLNAIIDLGA